MGRASTSSAHASQRSTARETLADIETRLRKVAKELNVELEFAQKSGEGELVDVDSRASRQGRRAR